MEMPTRRPLSLYMSIVQGEMRRTGSPLSFAPFANSHFASDRGADPPLWFFVHCLTSFNLSLMMMLLGEEHPLLQSSHCDTPIDAPAPESNPICRAAQQLHPHAYHFRQWTHTQHPDCRPQMHTVLCGGECSTTCDPLPCLLLLRAAPVPCLVV
jgi:hypothetical protein